MSRLEFVQQMYCLPEFRYCQYISNFLSLFLLICRGRLPNGPSQRNLGLDEGVFGGGGGNRRDDVLFN